MMYFILFPQFRVQIYHIFLKTANFLLKNNQKNNQKTVGESSKSYLFSDNYSD